MPESLISSVGRGYSDLCAALVAASVEAQELQIWKEVDVGASIALVESSS